MKNLKRKPYLLLLCIASLLSGCMHTKYSHYNDGETPEMPTSRVVKFEINDRFYQEPPKCVTVLPVKGMGGANFRNSVGATTARHLFQKVNRVIGPYERTALEKKLAYDLTYTRDRRQFSKHMNCEYFVQVTVLEATKTYAVVWAQQLIHLKIKLHGLAKEKFIWRASHSVTRENGGLPLSPFSLGSAIIKAGKSHGETDTFSSMLDDGIRRMFVKLPDTRLY